MTSWGYPPYFWRKSAEVIGVAGINVDTENERVWKWLKRRRAGMRIGKWKIENGGEGNVRTSWGPSVTKHFSIGLMTLSIVNYVVHRSNGWAFERESNQ
jgi:hypothetical protein